MQHNQKIWKDILDEDLKSIKVLTSEVVYVDPITVEFNICAAPVQRALEYFNDDVFDSNNESYLEITISDNSLYSNASIKTQINSIFMNFFAPQNQVLGQIVNINSLESQIYAIPGIQRIRTVFSSNQVDDNGNKLYNDIFIDGISFATWSSSLIDLGDDISISTINRSLEDFQFPHMYKTTITDCIKIIKKSFSNSSAIQY